LRGSFVHNASVGGLNFFSIIPHITDAFHRRRRSPRTLVRFTPTSRPTRARRRIARRYVPFTLDRKKVLGALILHPLLCLKSGTPTCMKRTSSSLSESCPKIGDLPKSPFPPVAALVPSAGIITLQISLVRRGCHQHLCLYIRTLLAACVSH
jgi:hypothetical protein